MLRTLAIALVLLAGCQDYVFTPACPVTIEESKVTATPSRPTPADILFVVDNSGSMADDQRRLAASFDAFITQLTAVPDLSYRIAIVTTDLSTQGGEKAGEQFYNFQSSAPYQVLGVNDNACTDTGIPHGCFRGPLITSEMSAAEQDAAFTSIVTVGSCGSGTEEGLNAAVRALQSNCNDGFIRDGDGTNLVVVFVTDEQDASPGNVSEYVNALESIAAAHGKRWKHVRAAGIFGSVDGRASGCAAVGGLPSAQCGSLCNECPGASWCDNVDRSLFDGGCSFCSYFNAPDCCSAAGGSRYEQFLGIVDQRVKADDPNIGTATLIDSICQDDFSATLKRIAAEIIIDICYKLADQPINPDGIAVGTSGGRQLQRDVDFTVNRMANPIEVCLKDATVLQPGEELEISFVTHLEKRPSVHPSCN